MRKVTWISLGSIILLIFANTLTALPVQTAPAPDQMPDIDPGEDVITASDGAGGYLTTRDIILIVIIVFAIIGVAAVL